MGLNILLDEVECPAALWAKAPRFVSIALTNACDLKCPYCYAPKHKARLSLKQVIRWASELDLAGCLGVGFGGGEPTVWPRFPELCRRLSEETQLAVTFTTHGHHLARLGKDLAGSVHFLRISVDATGPLYERLRGRSFDDVCRALEAAQGVAPFGLNMVVNDETVAELDRVCDLAGKFGARELLLIPEVPTPGRPGISELARAQVNSWIREADHTVALSISAREADADLPLARPFPGDDSLSYAHISADGQLKRTSYSDVGHPIGEDLIGQLTQMEEHDEDLDRVRL